MKNHYDICVAGFWYGVNYGSLLNGYATYRLLKDMGKDVLMMQKPNVVESDPEIIEGHNTYFVNKCYDKEDISPSLPYDKLIDLNDLCDCFCAGSDQIWNYIISFDENMYLSFANDDKKIISYASSFGSRTDNVPFYAKERVQRYFQRYHAISGREHFGAEILKEKYGLYADVVIDPVFCLDKEVYVEMAKNSRWQQSEPYLLAYILDPTPRILEIIKSFSKNLGVELYIIADGAMSEEQKKTRFFGLNLVPDPTVEEFLYAFLNAAYVITDSFHGTAFSIIFNKSFLSIGNYERGYERFADLLGRFSLTERLIDDPEIILKEKSYLASIDYTNVNAIIGQEVEKAVQWLERAVNTPKSELLLAKNELDGMIRKLQKSTILSLPNENCTGCGACYNICPQQAIAMLPDPLGFLHPHINGNCINCGLCVAGCPKLNPHNINTAEPECYAVRANDEIREVSSSGGMFSVFANWILDQGGVVCGATMEKDYSVHHICIKSREELHRLQKSKYVQSSTEFVFREVADHLKASQCVLFSGCPCQVAAMRSYAAVEKVNTDKLYCIDILCRGVPSQQMWQDYVCENFDQEHVEAIEFRNKLSGWRCDQLQVFCKDGSSYVVQRQNSAYEEAFHAGIDLRDSCGDCEFCGKLRQGDVTIGDFWSIDQFAPGINDGKGVNLLLVNNDKGSYMVECIRCHVAQMQKTLFSEVAKTNRFNKEVVVNPNRKKFQQLYPGKAFTESVVACREIDTGLEEKHSTLAVRTDDDVCKPSSGKRSVLTRAIQCYKDNGFLYTCKRLWIKVRGKSN